MLNNFILVRPAGGAADMFSQIGEVMLYAKKYKRLVVVDTNLKMFFGESLGKYFHVAPECAHMYLAGLSLDDSFIVFLLQFF